MASHKLVKTDLGWLPDDAPLFRGKWLPGEIVEMTDPDCDGVGHGRFVSHDGECRRCTQAHAIADLSRPLTTAARELLATMRPEARRGY